MISFHAFCKVGQGVGYAVNLCMVFILIVSEDKAIISVPVKQAEKTAVWNGKECLALTVGKTDFILPFHAAPPPKKK